MTFSLFSAPEREPSQFVGFSGNRIDRQAENRTDDVLETALADQPPVPFRMPPGIKLVRVSVKTGLRAAPEDTSAIMEAFKTDEEPDDAYSVIGFTDPYARSSDAGTSGGGWQPAPSASPGYSGGPGGLW